MALIFLDTETTGLHNDSNLLELFICVIDENYNIKDELCLNLRPDPLSEEKNSDKNSSIYSIQIPAMKINKINLEKHDLIAVPYKLVKSQIYQWLEKTSLKYGKLIPVGNNIQQDIDKICQCVISKKSWENFCDRRVIDLTCIGQVLKDIGKIPTDQSLSLLKLSEYFNIKINENDLHTSRGDSLLGLEVYKNYLNLMKG